MYRIAKCCAGARYKEEAKEFSILTYKAFYKSITKAKNILFSLRAKLSFLCLSTRFFYYFEHNGIWDGILWF